MLNTGFPSPLLRINSNQAWYEEVAHRAKNAWVATPNQFKGDLPPVILPERGERLLAYIVAPTPDKEYAFIAAALCRRLMAADRITLILDGHIPIGDNVDQVAQRVAKGNFPAGEMQRACDQEAACDRGLYSDCIIVIRGEDKDVKYMRVFTYAYHGKGQHDRVEWTPQHDVFQTGEGRADGHVPNALREILQSDAEDVDTKIWAALGINPRSYTSEVRRLALTTLAMAELSRKGFTVHDFSSGDYHGQPVIMR